MSASPLISDSSTITADMADFSYRTQLVIYNFLRYVPSSAAAFPNDQRAAEQTSLCSVTPSDNAAGNIERDSISQQSSINGRPADHSAISTDTSNSQKLDGSMFVNQSKSRQNGESMENLVKDSVGHHLAWKTGTALRSAPITVIKKKSSIKILEPVSPHDAHTRFPRAFQLMPSGDLSSLSSPVLGTPQHTSTPFTDKPEQRTDTDSDGGSGVEYVDIEDMDPNSLVENTENGVLPSVCVPLQMEITNGIKTLQREYSRQISERCEDEFDCGSPFPAAEKHATTPPLFTAGSPTPEQMEAVAAELRVMGDLLQLEYSGRLDNIVSSVRGLPRDLILTKAREQFDVLLGSIGDKLTQVALTLLFCQRLVYCVLSLGLAGIRDVVMLTSQIIETYAGEFIIQHGGWNAALAEVNVVELPLEEEVRQNGTQSETAVPSTDGRPTSMDHSGGAGDGIILPPDAVDGPDGDPAGSKNVADGLKSVEGGNNDEPTESEPEESQPVESKLGNSEQLAPAPVEGAGNVEPTSSLGNQVYIIIGVALLAVAAFAYRRSRSSS